MATATDKMNIKENKYLVGRQPILNDKEEIVAYELLFRSPGAQSAVFEDATQATAKVILNTLTGFGIDSILGDHQGFINVGLELLMDDALNLLPKEYIVIELLEALQVNAQLIERCRALKRKGFVLALDDHQYHPAFHELYQLVDIVKVDLIQTPMRQVKEMVEQLRRYPLKLLAEKVETQEDFSRCLALGFQLFQGYYFAKPSVMEKKRFDDCGFALMKLIRLLDEDAELNEIEKTFRGHAVLTYKLLLLVNSVGVGARHKIHTVRHAVSILGRQQIKRWVQLALLAGYDQRGTENPLVDMAAVRASFMENLVGHHQLIQGEEDPAEKAFMIGILSILEMVYDISMDELVRHLNLSDDIRDALIKRSGKLGKILHATELLERLEFDHIERHLEEIGVTFDDILAAQKRAYAWRGGMA